MISLLGVYLCVLAVVNCLQHFLLHICELNIQHIILDTFVIYSCTAVRIPTSRAHSESIIALFDKPVDVAVARKALDEAPGVKLVDDPDNSQYPMPLTAAGQYDVEVGRLRKSIAFENALEFFVCGDQLLRGAALNAVLVAEAMVENGALKT